MKGISKLIKKELKRRNKTKTSFNSSMFYVTLDMEFAKWLNYTSEEEKERINYLLSLNIEELTNNQVEELKLYNEEKIYSKLFDKFAYHLENCNNEEYVSVSNYMNSHSIEELMNRKLSKVELIDAKNKIIELYVGLSKKKLYNYLISFNTIDDINSYKNMSIFDSYLFHYLSNTYIENNITCLCNKTDADLDNHKVYVMNALKQKAN